MYVIMFAAAVVFSMPVLEFLRKKAEASHKRLAAFEVGYYAVSVLLFAVCTVTLSSASYNPFIYFRF